MENLLFAVLVAIVVWLLVRHARLLKARRAPPPPAATMPRLGTPGTATPEQLARMRACHFDTAGGWSREEADLILDAVDYLRAALREQGRRGEAPLELQNRVLVFLLADDELRESVRRWGAARRAGASGPVLAGVQGARVAGFLRGL